MESNYEKLKEAKQQIKYRLQNDALDGVMYCDLQQTGDEEASQALITGASTFDLAFMVDRVIESNPEIIPIVTNLLLRSRNGEVTFDNYDFGGQTND